MDVVNELSGRRTPTTISHTRNSSDSMVGYSALPPSLRPKTPTRDPSPIRHHTRDSSPMRHNRFGGSSIHTSSSSQSLRALALGQSPAGTPTFGPATAVPLAADGSLLPPPRIGSPFREPHSPSSSKAGSRAESRADSRAESRGGSRPASPAPSGIFRPATPSKIKAWLPGKSHSRSQSTAEEMQGPPAWVIGPQGQVPYDVSPLGDSQVIPELWDDSGNTLVYLFPKSTGRGPSFRISFSAIVSSRTFTMLASEGDESNGHHRSQSEDRTGKSLYTHVRQLSLDVPSTIPELMRRQFSTSSNGSLDEGESSADIHLYMPLGINPNSTQSTLSPEDIENLVAVRNLFAFLAGQSLVATPNQPTIFSILLNVSGLFRHYEFSNLDGSTLGEVPDLSFRHYIEELGLADIRASREKTIEALVLGERMRSWDLYNEAFVHFVGKYDDIMKLGSPKYSLVSEVTSKRMERASMDLSLRIKSVRTRLDDFDLPSLFAGVANSSTESREVRFKGWKSSFMTMRKQIMALYKSRYGAWPPKAKSKKNDFEESGLNRILLIELYQDFSDLYDMLVDRSNLTTRATDISIHEEPSSGEEPISKALRSVMDEFDHSSPPVQPPVPFDTPLLPTLATTRRDYKELPPKKQIKEQGKKLKDNEINQALMQSYNRDSVKSTPFLESFMAFERSSAHGRSMDEIVDLRIGQWIFMYVVLQSLPMVVVDAPDVTYASGVEYFLCEVPKGSPPWSREETGMKKSWYGVAGGAGLVSLPADIVEHGVEGIYRRSHCWQAADRWTGGNGHTNESDLHSPLYNNSYPPPPIMVPDLVPGSRTSSPDRNNQRDSFSLGLEALPLPHGVSPSGAKSVPTHDPTKSFEDILGSKYGDGNGKKK